MSENRPPLAYINPSLAELRSHLASPLSARHATALHAILAAPSIDAASALARELDHVLNGDSDPSLAPLAIRALERAGHLAIPALAAALAGPLPLPARGAAAAALGRVAAAAREEAAGAAAIQALSLAATSAHPKLRETAVLALSHTGSAAAARVLVRLLADTPDPAVASACANALGDIGPTLDPTTAAAIGPLLRSRASAARSTADGELELACVAAHAFITGSPRSALPPLTRALEHPRAEVRLAALQRLGALRGASKSAHPRIGALLDDAEPQVRALACLTLARTGATAAPWPERLAARLADREPETRAHALMALHALGPAALPWLDAIRRATSDPNPQCAAIARAAAQRVATPAKGNDRHAVA